MRVRTWLMVLLLATVTGCGGGAGSVVVSTAFPGWSFVFWDGNSSAEQVVDANNDAFAFVAETGCLFNYQTGRENPHFCLGNGNRVFYGGLPMRVVNVRSVVGTCIAAIVDEATGQLIDIALNASGLEVVFLTQLHPALC